MTTGERIKAARQRAGLTQKDLGEKLGISYVGISQWENDQRKPKQETLIKIAKALGVHLRDLVDSSWLEEFDEKHKEEEQRINEELSHLLAISAYLKELGFSIEHRVTKWHDEEADDQGHTVPIPDESEIILSKDGHTAIFTEPEFDDLQAGAKEAASEAIERLFYKKVLEGQRKK